MSDKILRSHNLDDWTCHGPDCVADMFPGRRSTERRSERAALDEIREIVQAALDESDLSKLDLPRILELCGKEKEQ